MFTDADLIHAYTRAQAIEDGQLVDVTEAARSVGIKCPVAITRAVFVKCVEVPKSRARLEDEAGRLHDVVWMLACGMRRNARRDRFVYSIRCSTRAGIRRVNLKAMMGAGDAGEAVVTVMMVDED